jgi:hypothetical protein
MGQVRPVNIDLAPGVGKSVSHEAVMPNFDHTRYCHDHFATMAIPLLLLDICLGVIHTRPPAFVFYNSRDSNCLGDRCLTSEYSF